MKAKLSVKSESFLTDLYFLKVGIYICCYGYVMQPITSCWLYLETQSTNTNQIKTRDRRPKVVELDRMPMEV